MSIANKLIGYSSLELITRIEEYANKINANISESTYFEIETFDICRVSAANSHSHLELYAKYLITFKNGSWFYYKNVKDVIGNSFYEKVSSVKCEKCHNELTKIPIELIRHYFVYSERDPFLTFKNKTEELWFRTNWNLIFNGELNLSTYVLSFTNRSNISQFQEALELELPKISKSFLIELYNTTSETLKNQVIKELGKRFLDD